MKRFIYFLIGLCVFSVVSLAPYLVRAQEKVEINFFYSVTCPHCAKEKVFLEVLKQQYPEIEINSFEFSAKENQEKISEFYTKYNISSNEKGLVPITFIKDRYFLGFSEQTTGRQIENYVSNLIKGETPEQIEGQNNSPSTTKVDKVKLPFLNEIQLSSYSLPALAVILGFFDGFNVCSLGALILILGIVLAFGSRAKTLIFGLAFILTTAVVYGMLIFVWHKIFLSLAPYISSMEIVIGLLALLGGIYFIWQFIKTKRDGLACESQGLVQKISIKLTKIISNTTNLIYILAAIVLFAAVVTMIEFPCSAVLPVIYAGIISEAGLSTFNSFLYIALFLFFYMLDEVIIFLIAFFTFKIWIASPRFSLWLNLSASIVLLILGSYYLRTLIS